MAAALFRQDAQNLKMSKKRRTKTVREQYFQLIPALVYGGIEEISNEVGNLSLGVGNFLVRLGKIN